MKSNWHRCFLAASLMLLFASPLFSQELLPVDHSDRDPSFAEFKTKLLQAIENDDREFLASVLDRPDSRDPRSLDVAVSKFRWQMLRDVLLLGVTRERDGRFCAPYIDTRFPGSPGDKFDYGIIIEEDVELKTEPYEAAPVASRLSYDVVVKDHSFSLSDRIEGERHEWLKVTTMDGRSGYVWGKYVRNPYDQFTACFVKLENQWLLDYIIDYRME